MAENLFKYLGVVAANSFLQEETIRFTPPNSYNDPFELSLDIRMRSNIEPSIAGLRFVLHGGKSVIENFLIPSERIDEYKFELANNVIEQLSSSVGTCCFSLSEKKIPLNLLMWAHYAESHRGIALKLKRGTELANRAAEVRYSKGRPVVDGAMFSDGSEISVSDLYVKSDHWQYERERRVAMRLADCTDTGKTDAFSIPVHVAKIPTNDVEQVVVGVNASEETKKLALEFHHRTGVQVVRVRPSGQKFGFEPYAVFGGDLAEARELCESYGTEA
ncbi:DUF2971 domain-containing protein [Photobacterium atrarenae]|uniref:DUF2971 domain-containing protein n=1 Tax=Photobacterium atrarenae TaxID=865757 RepID=A0ABY5GJS2_9GAMM|nr:DUF2971 domain-containing protein [Photobacterium atrarenae]UTV28959.1 DUF2971 domain-containing protein [Photobacterium atrarenae]